MFTTCNSKYTFWKWKLSLRANAGEEVPTEFSSVDDQMSQLNRSFRDMEEKFRAEAEEQQENLTTAGETYKTRQGVRTTETVYIRTTSTCRGAKGNKQPSYNALSKSR